MIRIDKILLLLFIIPSLVFSQEGIGSINALSVEITDVPSRKLLPIESIFKKFKQNITFLDEKAFEIKQLTTQGDTFNGNYINSKSNNKNIQLHFSFLNFTDYNTEKLNEIILRLNKETSLQGCEISYLNKSFYVYKKYIEFNYLAQGKTNEKGINNQNKAPIYLLHSQLNQLSFFYKNYFKSIKNKQVRRVLNTGDLAFKIKKNDFKKLTLKQLRRKNYKSIQKSINNTPSYPDSDLLIDTVLYKNIKNYAYKNSFIKKNKRNIRRLFNQDNTHNTGRTIMHHLSGVVGNFTGLFRFRKGYLYKNDSIYNEIHNRLKPMDIIAEKTSFSITDKLIPGHFGHIAIWLGTQKQLQDSNLWNHPSIVPFHEQIIKGFSILETDRKGTHLKALRDFLNVDELAILRINDFENIQIDYKKVIYDNSLAQLGKKYDFNFDLETTDKLFCSELLYYIFGPIHWPIERHFNRSSITPDNVLSLTLYKNSPTSLIYYISAENRETISQKSLIDLSTDLGFQKKNDAFILNNKKCKKERNKAKKKCASANSVLEYR